LVFGGTGQQGGSVINAALEEGNWRLRTLTRHPDSDCAKHLSSRGVEVIEGDEASPSQSFFQDVYGVFLVTAAWDSSVRGKEFEVGKQIVDMAAKMKVKHFIFSSLANVEEESNGKYNVPLFTEKAKIENYIREKDKSFEHITFVGPAFYYQNFLRYFKIQDNGELSITLPETKMLTAYDVWQTGKAVLAVFKNPDWFQGKFIPLVGENAPPQDYVNNLATKIGKNIKLNLVPWEKYAKLPLCGAEEFGPMFGWFDEYTYYGRTHDIWLGKQLIPSMRSFKEWLGEVPTNEISIEKGNLQKEPSQ